MKLPACPGNRRQSIRYKMRQACKCAPPMQCVFLPLLTSPGSLHAGRRVSPHPMQCVSPLSMPAATDLIEGFRCIEYGAGGGELDVCLDGLLRDERSAGDGQTSHYRRRLWAME